VKPVNLNELLFHEKTDTLTFFLPPARNKEDTLLQERFIDDVQTQLQIQEKESLKKIVEKSRLNIRKILKSHQEKSHGFFLSDQLQGYTILQGTIDPYCLIGQTFHIRPVLEELFVNPEFLLVNISFYEIKIYRADFQQLEIIEQYDFDELPKNFSETSRVFSPQFLGLVPHKNILALKKIAQKIKDMILYESLPVVVTGLEDMKKIFLRYFDEPIGVITHFDEDFYEKTSMEILSRCERFRYAVTDYYSLQLKERLKRMIKSRYILSDLGEIIKATYAGKVLHLVIPSEQKLWGKIDPETGEFTIHKKFGKTSVDLFNELAEEVMRRGGKIKILGPHFFPHSTKALAILRGQR
jgi:hypothetical protein